MKTMTEEEKQLLFEEISARVPHRVKVYTMEGCLEVIGVYKDINNGEEQIRVLTKSNVDGKHNNYPIEAVKLCLHEFDENNLRCELWSNFKTVKDNMRYLVENHYDVNHLIDKNLAISY